ncbi:hypothetical protein J3P80_12455 [Pseudomonas sp. D2-30]|uniref:hypothetical protein n=1 Tax=unclassified Pseudomonas TaxID=196821 RepID=UPI003DA8F415
MLRIVEQSTSDALRQRMEKAGCAFDFLVFAPEAVDTVDQALHGQAVDRLFQYIKAQWLEQHRQLVVDPSVADVPPPNMNWDLAKARPRALGRDEILQLVRVEKTGRNPESFALYDAFCEPPYGTRFVDDTPQALFKEWLDVLGLAPDARVVVVDWVDNFNFNGLASDEPDPTRDPWSDYFADGMEWWGVWCLSIWNPERCTLGVLAASTTD